MHGGQPDNNAGTPAAAAGDADKAAAEAHAVREVLAKSLAEVDAIAALVAMRPATREGWHEVHFLDANGRDQFGYASDDGQTFFIGEMIDLKAKVSVSLLSALEVRDSLLTAESGSGRVINWPAPEAKQRLYAFTNPTCDGCVQLHESLPELRQRGITVTYLAFPEGEKGSASYDASLAAWCAPDPQDGFAAAISGARGGQGDCEATVEHHLSLGGRLGVQSLPMLVSSRGMHVAGFPGRDELLAQLTPPPEAPHAR